MSRLFATFVASEWRVRAASNPKRPPLLVDFSRVFGLIWPLSRMLKPVLYPRFCCRRHLAGTIAGYHLKGRAPAANAFAGDDSTGDQDRGMTALRLILPIMLACVCAIAAYRVVPHGVEAEQLLYAQDDPVLLTDHQLARVFNAEVAAREIEAALVLDDADLAQSFLDLARDRNVTVDPALVGDGRSRFSGWAGRNDSERSVRHRRRPRRRARGFAARQW